MPAHCLHCSVSIVCSSRHHYWINGDIHRLSSFILVPVFMKGMGTVTMDQTQINRPERQSLVPVIQTHLPRAYMKPSVIPRKAARTGRSMHIPRPLQLERPLFLKLRQVSHHFQTAGHYELLIIKAGKSCPLLAYCVSWAENQICSHCIDSGCKVMQI